MDHRVKGEARAQRLDAKRRAMPLNGRSLKGLLVEMAAALGDPRKANHRAKHHERGQRRKG